ncbi:MAG TPA: efflux RND transporter permease subunit [Gemmataceae bacterium]|jgi:multidrug efflux pump|nr:efflux RND transporter permease subunit [Gemmataceae bacterium]
MISRFFIDRPIFATVLSVVITLIGAIALAYLPIAQYPRITPPGVVIAISYPGASAQVVADTVAAPIEQQVNGVPGMLYMSSQMGNDGSYSLTVTFDIGTDLNTAVVMVQNRVALAMPQLPSQVQNQGITIRKKTPDILMIVNFYSPNDRYDDIFLSNYATIYVRDELLRVPGVSDVNYQGQRDYSIRAWLDPQHLAARNMTAMDVANAIRSQNLDAPAGQIGQPPSFSAQGFQLPLSTLGRLHEPEQFENIIVKVGYPPSRRPAPRVTPPRANQPGLPDVSKPDTTVQMPGASSSSMSGSSMSSSMTTLGIPAGAAASSGGANTTGGGTTAGGANASGGGGASGAATSSGSSAATTGSTSSTSTDGAATTGVGTTSSPADTLSIPNVSDLASGGLPISGASAPPRGPSLTSPSIVRLKDVARVELGAQNYNQSCRFDGKPSVGLTVYQLPGTNALDVADAVRAKMEELKTRFPEGVDYAIGYDTTPYIRESVQDVVLTLLEAVALVGLVVLVFLQDWRAMVLPLIDVPVSIIGTFAIMAALGFSLNNISLFGLVLAIGIVVDDAIVVLENIERLMATGLEAREATIKAMNEVTGPIIAVALVLCAVFVPCAFISGITGQFFHQFAVTIAVSTVISAINAITMTPSRAVLIFKAEKGEHGRSHGPRREALPWWIFAVVGGVITIVLGQKYLAGHFGLPDGRPGEPKWHGWAIWGVYFLPGAVVGGLAGWFVIQPVNGVLGWSFRGFNRLFDSLTAGYAWIVGKSLRLNLIVLVGYAVLVGLTVWEFERAPVGFIPQQDQGRIIINIQLPDGASLEQTKDVVARVDKTTRETDGVAHTVSIAGLSFLAQAASPNYASMFVVLKPFAQRQKPGLKDTDIMAKLRQRWKGEIPDAVVTPLQSSPVPGLGLAGGFKLVVEDRGDTGLDSLQQQTDALVAKLRGLPGISSVTTQFRSNIPQLFLEIDRTKAAALGVSLTDVNQTLEMYMGSLYVNSFNDFGRHWQVTIQAEGDYRKDISSINLFQVRNNKGQMVPLGTLVTTRSIGGPISVQRYNLYTGASISGNVAPDYSTGDMIKAIEQVSSETLPITMKTEWTELAFMQLRAGDKGITVFLLAILSVFLALSALYESWTLPLAVILVVPMCMLSSIVGVRNTGRDVNIFVQIGLVVLVGLACKNAILVVEYAKQMHVEGKPRYESTVLASRLRLRPILMTSFAFIFGVIPLVIASGAGAEMRRSLGTAVFSGMLGVTLFGIFLTPVFFYVIQGMGETRLLSSTGARRFGSFAAGGVLGGAIGFLLGRLGVVRQPWGAMVGAIIGVSLLLAIFEFRRRVLPLLTGNGTPSRPSGSNSLQAQ